MPSEDYSCSMRRGTGSFYSAGSRYGYALSPEIQVPMVEICIDLLDNHQEKWLQSYEYQIRDYMTDDIWKSAGIMDEVGKAVGLSDDINYVHNGDAVRSNVGFKVQVIDKDRNLMENISGDKGKTIEEILSRIPEDAQMRVLKPAAGKAETGVEFSWTVGDKTIRVSIHGIDPPAPSRSMQLMDGLFVYKKERSIWIRYRDIPNTRDK